MVTRGLEFQHCLPTEHWGIWPGTCVGPPRNDLRKPHAAPSSRLPAAQPCLQGTTVAFPVAALPTQPHPPLRTSQYLGCPQKRGAPSPNTKQVQLIQPQPGPLGTTGSSSWIPGDMGPTGLQKTIQSNVAPFKCKTTTKLQNHCVPSQVTTSSSLQPGQVGEGGGDCGAGRVPSPPSCACGYFHTNIRINCAIFVPVATGCHFCFPGRRAWCQDISLSLSLRSSGP